MLKWFIDCMFEFILCINWKSVLWCPWNLLYCCPWLVKFVKWRCKRRYTSKTWYQKLKKTQIILLLLVCWLSVTPFGVWVCECACMESRRNTECTCNFAPRPDGDSIFFTGVFLILHVCKLTGIFVSAVTTCDKFLCCYCETCRCWSWPSSESSWIS